MSTPKLPIELVEMILDWLNPQIASDDEKIDTLNQCALVCRAWVQRCRYYQFSGMVIGEEADWTRWANVYNSPNNVHFIRTVALYSCTLDDLRKIRRIAPQLSRLEDLYIEFLDLRSLPQIGVFDLPVRKLHFDGLHGKTMKDVWKFICGFPNLEILDFRRVSFDFIGGNNYTEGLASFPPVTHIGVEDYSGSGGTVEFVRALAELPFAAHLKALRISWPDHDEHYLNMLLALCGSTLTRLDLKLSFIGNPSVDLTHNVALRTLELMDPSTPTNSGTLFSVPCNIRNIVFNFVEQRGPLCWLAIDEHFSHSKFLHLQKLVIICGLDVQQEILSQLPQLQEKCRIDFLRARPFFWRKWSGETGLRPTNEM